MSRLLSIGWAAGGSPATTAVNDPDTVPPLTQVSVLSPNNHIPTPPNGPTLLPGLVGSGRMVGERLSSSGTRLDTCSPLGLAKSSTESLRPRPFKSVSRQSLLDIVTSKLGVARKTPHQRYLSRWRDSMSAASGGCVTRGVASEMDLSRRPGGGGGGGGRRPNQSGPGPIRPPKLLTAATPTSVASGGGGHPPSSRSFTLVFDPAGRLCYYWSMVVSIAFLYNFWVIIYRFAFQEINRDSILVWFCLDYFADFLYIVDILFHFRTGYLEDGVLQTDSTKLRTHYMNSTTFYIDCLCLLPLDILYLSIGFNSILRSFRLVKIYRFWAFMDRTERHTNYPNLFRSTSLIHYLLVIFHWNGCLYRIIYKNNGFGSKNWVFGDGETADVVKQYLQSYYWCTLALTTIGDLPRPRSKGEYVFVILQLLFGLLLFATVLGHVANIVTSVSAARKEFQETLCRTDAISNDSKRVSFHT
ncbi:Hypothetical protein NTJ_08652 [Nesidiocoris tenuis]|uniref:Ion transport domain-containing protein n=2 Tax=Nesidiocoris tenuis TaxID=355587 RepID=A0ABN7AUI4_9HEMI|nr:Hypothetical protein NTJ_08652 [Nesidiocoris tenuis]